MDRQQVIRKAHLSFKLRRAKEKKRGGGMLCIVADSQEKNNIFTTINLPYLALILILLMANL